ncbi:MAG: alpha/beta hydrolase [Acidimicrobiia bacterium]
MTATTTAPLREDTIRLADGRKIGFAEYGDPEGVPLLWFHGTPGARGQIPPRARIDAAERGVRIIAVERPGTGQSTGHLHGAMVDWAGDVEQIADALGLERFGVAGLSGGGPYALACAHELPHRVVAGMVLGGVAPTTGPDAAPGGIVRLAAYAEPILSLITVPLGVALTVFARAVRPFASQAFDLYKHISPEGDKRVFEQPGMKEMFTGDLIRAGKHQLAAPAYDIVLFGRHWGFSLQDIEVPIRFWHGDSDNLVPLEHAEHQAALVPDSELRVRPGESHLGGFDAFGEIIDQLLDLWERANGEAATTEATDTATAKG